MNNSSLLRYFLPKFFVNRPDTKLTLLIEKLLNHLIKFAYEKNMPHMAIRVMEIFPETTYPLPKNSYFYKDILSIVLTKNNL